MARPILPGVGKAALLLILIAVPNVPAAARKPAPSVDEQHIGQCIRKVSQGKPWLEKTLWGLRDQEGGWIGAEIPNSNGSRDLGPLQVNSWWVPRIASMLRRSEDKIRWWLRNDPCFNIDVARWIFLSGLQATGDYWTAVGVYHSPTAWRQRRYIGLVATHMVERFGRNSFGE